ncbi:MAG TPA: hypothetical protein VFP72_10775 [Kineosporiaceae bacterium]|nr:hypothetical protein [Kineosporiaceae bacterium]
MASGQANGRDGQDRAGEGARQDLPPGGTVSGGTVSGGTVSGGSVEGGAGGTGPGVTGEDPGLVLAYGALIGRAQVRRLVTGGLALLAFLVVFVVGVLAGPVSGSGLQALGELLALACAGYAGWALPGTIREVLAGRAAWDRLGPVVRLNREGVEFRSRRDGPVVVFAPWDLVERCDFRPGPGGVPMWCVDAPVSLPPSLSFAAAWAGMVPRGQIDSRVDELAATWRALGAPADPRLLRDTLMFGTPIVMDLTRCPGVTVPQLDAAVRTWTYGRCGCTLHAQPRPAALPVIELDAESGTPGRIADTEGRRPPPPDRGRDGA